MKILASILAVFWINFPAVVEVYTKLGALVAILATIIVLCGIWL